MKSVLISVIAVLTAHTAVHAVESPAGAKPNFLLIVADDLCWRDLGFTGNKEVKTPNLDRLRSQGMYLSHIFTPAPTCSPARHALYTGLHGIRSGAYPNHTRAYDGTKSVFTHLAAAGYRVALHGKNHVGPKASFPFETLAEMNDDDFGKTRTWLQRDTTKPWLLVFGSNDPHAPWDRGPKGLHDPAKITVPPYLHDNADTRQNLADYYAEINKLDWQVGELLRILAELGQADNTLVMFVSEQGSSFPYGGKWTLYDNGIRAAGLVRWPGKVQPGSSSAALMQYTDVPPTLLAAAGVDPTTIDTGCPDANGYRGFDGKSFLDLLTGKADRFRDYVFAQHTTVGISGYKDPYPIRAVHDARYSYIRNLAPQNTFEIGGFRKMLKSWEKDARKNPKLAARVNWVAHRPGEELYDLHTDEYQLKNRAADPAFAEVKARLAKELDAWMAQQGDKGMATEMVAHTRLGHEKTSKAKADLNDPAKKAAEPAPPEKKTGEIPPAAKEPAKKQPSPDAARRPNALVEFVDVYPTLADLCDLPVPKGLEGVSLKPLLENPAASVKKVALSQYPRSASKAGGGAVMGYSIRDERWRLTLWRNRKDGSIVAPELYDEANDPAETVNLADRTEHRAVIQGLSSHLPPLPAPPTKKR
jgi:uncharacterized sulfatase